MSLVLLALLLTATPEDVVNRVEKELAADLERNHIRYFSFQNIPENKRDEALAVLSFTLNSISLDKKIIVPKFSDKDKLTVKVDLRDYKIKPDNYSSIGKDNFFYKHYTQELAKIMNSQNYLVRVEWFITRAMTAPYYYKIMGVSNLDEFKTRSGYDAKLAKNGELAAIIVHSKLARATRYFKRSPTVSGYMWEARDSAKIDYLKDLLSENYESVELLSSNPNGLLSYFAADSKGIALDHIDVAIAVDHQSDDKVVRVAKSCVACHHSGVVPIVDEVRNIFKNFKNNIKIQVIDENGMNRFKELFLADLPIKEDQTKYLEALNKATSMDGKTFSSKFADVWKNFYKDLTFEQAAAEFGMDEKKFREYCLNSADPHLLGLLIRFKIQRVHFEEILGER